MLDQLVESVTSKTGLFAAVVAIVGLLATVIGIVRPTLIGRKKPRLIFSSLKVEDPPPWSNAGEATFELMNAGAGRAVLTELLLTVSDHGAAEMPALKEVAAPVAQFAYIVTLSPSTTEYDVRQRKIGSAPPHSYEEGEVESFRIELRSTEAQWYEFEFVVRWYDARRPARIVEVRSESGRIEFPPDVEDLL